MTWRGRVSLGDDLRRLHESGRASDMSREIGYSSVTEGEGSLDLLTPSGDVRASLGDQPDGRFGVSIWHREQLRFIPDLIQELQDEDEALSGRISGLGDRMVSAEGRLDGHDSTLASHNTRISGLGDRMVSAEGRLDGHDSTLSSHGSRISGVESVNSTQNSRLTSVESKNSTQDSRISALEGQDHPTPGEVAALRDRVASVEAQISVIDSWLRQHTGYPSGGLNPNS